jgi:lysophospholipase L1-like esterase
MLAVLCGLIPLLLAECVLRFAGCGLAEEISDPFVGFSAVRPLFELTSRGDRYETSPSRLSYFCRESFAAEKPLHEFRVFCLGGSTVQGRPYAIETSFTAWLELRLHDADPSRCWRVVNCGGVSYASYRLVPILEEVLQYDPDLIILYTGHNEFLEERTYAQVRRTPRIIAALHGMFSQLRTYNVLRSAWLRAKGEDINTKRAAAHRLPDEVDALLDVAGGLESYRRDDKQRRGAAAHFEFNLRRMIAMARAAGVPLVLVNPVSNLKDCPPFKVEGSRDLDTQQRQRFTDLWRAAREQGASPQRKQTLLREALSIDDQHAGAHFLLGHCLLAERKFSEAHHAFVRAKDEDVCPLRILESFHEVLQRVARATNTPLVDVRGLFEELSPARIPGDELLMDHVHPTITGHQRIADALADKLTRLGYVPPTEGWSRRRDKLYQDQLAKLDAAYFARGKERLEGLQRWTEGRAGVIQHAPLPQQPGQPNGDPALDR